MTAADQPTTEPSAEPVPIVYSVDRSWEQHMRVDADGSPYDSRKMHRTWPSNDDRYGTAACSRRVILNIEDAMPADDPLVGEGMLCRRCVPDQPPVEAPRPVLMEWAQRAVECESTPAPQPAADTERDERLREDGMRRIGERVATARTYGSTGINAWASRYASDVPWLLAEVTRLDAVVTAVRELHQPVAYGSPETRAVAPWVPETVCSHCIAELDGCVAYPCATVRALDGGAR